MAANPNHGQYTNPWKMYLAGIWQGKKGRDVNTIFEQLGLPAPQHAFVIRGVNLRFYKVLAEILIFLDSYKNRFLGSEVRMFF